MPERPVRLVTRAAAVAASTLAIVLLLVQSWRIASYPFDWSPDEGLAHDYGARFRTDPASLYPAGGIPFPDAYGPLLPALLALVTAEPSIPAGRVLAGLWTLLTAAAAYRLARREGSALVGVVGALAALHPFSIMSWSLLARSDGLMLALWLWSAVCLLPREVGRGADRLDARRLALGGGLLFLSVTAKASAVVHGIPLVLVWAVVDGRSFWRLAGLMGMLGAAWVFALQALTSGSYLASLSSWTYHGHSVEQAAQILRFSLQSDAGGVLALAAAAGLSLRSGLAMRSMNAWVLILGGLATVPMLAKSGAAFNYMLPLVAGLGIAAAQGAARLETRRPLAARWILAGLAVWFLLAPAPRLPTGEDRRTSAFFYQATGGVAPGEPILALTPDWLYVARGQAVEMAGASLPQAVAANRPEARTILDRLRATEYRLVVLVPDFWPAGSAYRAALLEHYRLWGACRLGYFYGTGYQHVILVPRNWRAPFDPPADTRCAADPARLPPPIYYFD